MMKIRIFCACVCASIMLSSCGLKRDLHLPKTPKDDASQTQNAAPASAPAPSAPTQTFDPAMAH